MTLAAVLSWFVIHHNTSIYLRKMEKLRITLRMKNIDISISHLFSESPSIIKQMLHSIKDNEYCSENTEGCTF